MVSIAREWLGTPYHNNAEVKGAGVDCIRFIKGCYVNAGLIPDFELPHHSPQWALHRKLEMAMVGILRYGHEVGAPLPGDIAMFKIGLCWGHSSIVIDWPTIIHAMPPACRYSNAFVQSDLVKISTRDAPRFFSIWPRS